MLALFWKLWFERKGRLFEGKSQDARNLWITLSFGIFYGHLLQRSLRKFQIL